MLTVEEERINTLRELNAELRIHCQRLEYILNQREEFLRALCDPDMYGYAVSEEVRSIAYSLLRSRSH
ncbi:MAG: hypothetical protein EBT99_16005 [Betaproteobacteria bacterium]|nr:hypothetical protein [Betaproteobacteria bacterium]